MTVGGGGDGRGYGSFKHCRVNDGSITLTVTDSPTEGYDGHGGFIGHSYEITAQFCSTNADIADAFGASTGGFTGTQNEYGTEILTDDAAYGEITGTITNYGEFVGSGDPGPWDRCVYGPNLSTNAIDYPSFDFVHVWNIEEGVSPPFLRQPDVSLSKCEQRSNPIWFAEG